MTKGKPTAAQREPEELENPADEPAVVEDDTLDTVAPDEGLLARPTLSEDEYQKIVAQARAEIEAEQIAELKKRTLAAEKEKLRARSSAQGNPDLEGPKSDLVRVTIAIPEAASHINYVVIDGKAYYDGHTYTVRRHVGDTIREIQQNMRRLANEVDGKKRNRALPDGRFVDVITGGMSRAAVTISASEAA